MATPSTPAATSSSSSSTSHPTDGTISVSTPSTSIAPVPFHTPSTALSTYSPYAQQSVLSSYSGYSPMGLTSGYGGYGGYGGFSSMGMGLGGMGMLRSSPMSLMHGMETGIASVGRISQLFQVNFDALHMSVSAILRLVEHAYLLKHEFTGMGQTNPTSTISMVIRYVYMRCGAEWNSMLGKREAVTDAEKQQMWETAAGGGGNTDNNTNSNSNSNANGGHSSWGWLSTLFCIALLWSCIKWLWRKLRGAPSAEIQTMNTLSAAATAAGFPANDSTWQQRPAPYSNSLYGGGGLGSYGSSGYGSYGAGAYSSPYGGIGSGYNSLYGGGLGYAGAAGPGYGSSLYGSQYTANPW